MVKSKSNVLAKLPKEQRCQFLIGPISSWFMPNTTDVWTQSKENSSQEPEASRSNVSLGEYMDCDQSLSNREENASLSYFIYGSIGCFCYGEIHHHSQHATTDGDRQQHHFQRSQLDRKANMSATVNRLIDIKEDNSRVACVRFLKGHKYPLVMILTETGTFLVHDCLSNENLVHFKKSELVAKFIEPYCRADESNGSEHCNKRPKFNVTQQINSCVWPNAKNAFLGVSLLKEKTNLLFWLKLKDLTEDMRSKQSAINKSNFIESHVKIELDLPQYASPICCMEAAMCNTNTCLVAVAMDDGLISVVKVNFDSGQTSRVIKLARHNDQICSMSIYTENPKKFPSGLLASVSRNGLTLVWDIENEFYFADYQASSDSSKGTRINWFSLTFLAPKNSKQVHLGISNPESGVTVLEMPDNIRSKIRLKDNRDNRQKNRSNGADMTLRHHALLFNVVFDENTNTLLTTSLDGNHILWSCHVITSSNNAAKKESQIIELKPEYLFPSMANNSRTHMLRFNTIKEDLLGVALGKAGVRFYRIADNSMNHRFDMSTSCGIVARKITKASLSPTSIAWHPSHEYRVAIGTIEGKVLRVDLTPNKAMLVETEHKPSGGSLSTTKIKSVIDNLFDVEYKPLERNGVGDDDDRSDCTSVALTNAGNTNKTDGVYSLCWGSSPASPYDSSRLAIYAIGAMSKRLFIYYSRKENNDKMTNYLDEFHDESLPEANGRASEVAWKSSMDLMALGTTDGRIIIVSYLEESHADRCANKLFKRLAVIQGPLGNAHIQCLAWHPTTDKDDARYYYLAASAIDDVCAYVFNIKESLLVADVKSRLKLGPEPSSNFEKHADVTTSSISLYIHKLNAHKKAISDIAWNPHEPDQLATSSFDRCCYVWSLDRSLELELLNARTIAKFSGRDRLFTLEWSIVDTDLVFTSGHDSAIWAWRPSENPPRPNENV